MDGPFQDFSWRDDSRPTDTHKTDTATARWQFQTLRCWRAAPLRERDLAIPGDDLDLAVVIASYALVSVADVLRLGEAAISGIAARLDGGQARAG